MSSSHDDASRFVRAGALADVPEGKGKAVTIAGHVVALFNTAGRIFAVDNRCPHMGFPLDRGGVKDCILTCHWHHARFDLNSGGTFDQWADDVRSYPVKVEGGEIWIDLAERGDPHRRRMDRLRDGLERNIPLVIGKSVIALMDGAGGAREPFRAGLEFGVRYRRDGWGAGLTTLTCMMNLLAALAPEDRPRAMFHGLSSVASDTDGKAPSFQVRPLPGAGAGAAALKRWLRKFVEVRDSEGAERCIVSAVRAGCSPDEVAGMLFAAVTDHRYLSIGHALDFTNKAFEALSHAGWDLAEAVLASLARGYAEGDRMEESNTWRNPVDLVAILERAFESIPAALQAGQRVAAKRRGIAELIPILLGDDPAAIAEAMLTMLREGGSAQGVAGAVAYAAALRIARFPTSNEFGDWDTAHHSFTFANAVHQSICRVPSPELLRAAFDAVMTVYLDRFLNVPAANLPHPRDGASRTDDLVDRMSELLDRQQQVNQAGEMVGEYIGTGGEPAVLRAAIGHVLLREDRSFHTIQNVEAALRQHEALAGNAAGAHVLVAAARYLAAHSPTMRAQGQTYQIALRLNRGEPMFEGQ